MMIPHDDFGGRGPVLHFSHPNAYPPRCFTRFLTPLTARYRVLAAHHRPLWYLAPDAPSRNPTWAADWTWEEIGDDLLRFLDEQRLEAVIGVGHSLGGVATALAARKEPERFRALILIEPVFLSPAVLHLVATDPEHSRLRPMVEGALRRRDRWPSRRDAFDRFRAKSVFDAWSDDVLWDYVRHALHEDPATGEMALSFPREVEVTFYQRPLMDPWAVVPDLRPPTLAVRGTRSDTLFPDAWALWQQLQPSAAFVEMEDLGHMMTMEAPQDVAEVLLHWLEDRQRISEAIK